MIYENYLEVNQPDITFVQTSIFERNLLHIVVVENGDLRHQVLSWGNRGNLQSRFVRICWCLRALLAQSGLFTVLPGRDPLGYLTSLGMCRWQRFWTQLIC